MAHIAEGQKEGAWLQKLGAAAAAVKEKVQSPVQGDRGCVHPEHLGNVPEEPRQWVGFEFAELLEQGEGPGLTSRHMEPPRDRSEEQRLCVQRSQNRTEYVLKTEGGESLLLARSNANGTCYDLFIARDGQPPRALGPAFVLKSNPAKDQWSLHSVRCERCEARGKRQCGSRELARMTHYSEAVGDGQAFCLDVDIPEVQEDGSSQIFCSTCNDQTEWGSTEFTSRRPKWNAKHKSLTLDFHGRCTMASAKNIQLEAVEKPGKTKLLYGKVGPHQFVLDYRFPLAPVQAFAAALTTSHWK